jgi:putative membrane protein
MTICAGAALAAAQTQPAGSAAPQSGAAGGSGQYTPVEKHAGHKEDHGMSSNKGAGLMVNAQDQQFMVKAAQGGLMEVEAARLAQEKATSNEIKEFARKLEQDHQKANEDLKKLAAEKNVDLPTDMGQHAAMLEKVRAASGADFDKRWMKMQVQHHKKDVNDFQKQTTRAMDSDVRNFATAKLPTLQQHLATAQQLEQSTRGRKADSSSSSSSGSAADSGASTGSTGGSAAGSNSGASSTGNTGSTTPATK